jgi:hypothetical protein
MNRTLLLRSLLAAMLGVAAALIVACGSDNGKLIPYADAGPLKSDFEAVAQVAETGDGSCALTKAAIEKTEQDFRSLPATVDAGLRETMRQGIDNLRTQALTLCLQPIAQTTTTGTTATKTTPSTTTTSTTTTPTTTTTTSTTPTTPTGTTPSTTPTTTTSGGGTPAPGESPSGATGSPGGGTGVGESAAGGASGNGAESAAGSAENGK